MKPTRLALGLALSAFALVVWPSGPEPQAEPVDTAPNTPRRVMTYLFSEEAAETNMAYVVWPSGPEPQAEPVDTAPNTVVITLPPSTTSSTTSSTVIPTTVATTVPTTFPAIKPDHVCYDWLPKLLEAGWPNDPDILATALTIMWRESRCQPDADSGPDHGLFQINRFWSSNQSNPPNWLAAQGIAPNHDALFDPMTNIRAAWAIYQYSLNRNGDGFLPWTTYSGA